MTFMRLPRISVHVKRGAVLLLALLMVALAAGCGSGGKTTFSNGVIHIGQGVRAAVRTKSVLGISRGANESAVRARLGEPFAKVRAGRDICWAYHADQSGTSVDAIDFCMSPTQQVTRILL